MENKWTYRRNPRPEGDCGLNPTGINPGVDVNGDGNVNLADAIMVLKVLAGLEPAGLNLGADVNADGRIGLAELVYILQDVAGLR
jgi:hypothetical protein